MPLPSRSTLAAVLLVTVIGAFYLATIREGHVWGDDQAAYIQHAKNIREGRAYGDTGYIRTPTSLNPKMYPPVFPLLLAPMYYLFGLSLTPMKVMCIAFLFTSLFLFYRLARDAATETTALATVAVIGFCPYFWDFKDSLFSEYPFLAFAYAALLISHRSMERVRTSGERLAWGATAGLLCGLAYGTRSAGIVLVPSILLVEIIRTRRISRFGSSLCAGFAFCAILQKALFRVDSDYLGSYIRTFSTKELFGGVYHYIKAFAVMWENGYSAAAQMALYGVLCVLAVYGGYIRVQRGGWAVLDIFGLVYLAFILLFPWGGRRYLMPIMPVFVLYVLTALQFGTSSWNVKLRLSTQAAFGLIIALCFVCKYSTQNWHEIPNGIQSPEARHLVETVRQMAGSNDVVVFRKARFMALYTGMRSMDVFQEADHDKALRLYREAGASLFVVSRLFNDSMERELEILVRDRMNTFNKVYEDGPFAIYTFRKV